MAEPNRKVSQVGPMENCRAFGSSDLFAFQPNADRARRVEARVRAGLADSLAAALRALASEGVASGDDLVARVRAGPVSPMVFGAYTELVEAILSEDNDTAIRIADELCAPRFGQSGDLRIVTLEDNDLGAGQAARYGRLVDDDPNLGLELSALSRAKFASDSKRVTEALALLIKAAPELTDELHALVREIILADSVGRTSFGASSFQLWGALLLKLKADATRIEIAESLAHEGAHALLFGFGMGRPLVENHEHERYTSPLRGDPRPMDGVVHATYVVARMHYAVTRMLDSGLLTKEEAVAAREARERNGRLYADGLAVIETHAKWTRAGAAALSSSKKYMATDLNPASEPRGK
jgi:HEXXH motif-containing protein